MKRKLNLKWMVIFALFISSGFQVFGGDIIAWGRNGSGQTNAPDLSNLLAISAGRYHSLALKTDGTVVGWGDSSSGQTSIPGGLNGVIAISGGWSNSLALKQDGTVIGWGNDTYLQTTPPAGLSSVIAIAAGGFHSIALKNNGTVVAWGDNNYNQTNVPAGLPTISSISAGVLHNLALAQNGTVYAWGDNDFKQLNIPGGLNDVSAISAGAFHNLAVRKNGTVVAWGDNKYGQCNVPSGLANVVAVAAGEYHSLAMKADGSLVAWGDITYQQTTIPESATNILAIAAGADHCIALKGGAAPTITIHPVTQSVNAGQSVVFTVQATGTLPITYQWLYNGANIDGATANSLTLNNLQINNSGAYSVVVNNRFGTKTSSSATLTVLESRPKIISNPVSRQSFPGGQVTFTVSALGALPISYQWRLNGVNVNGANQASLFLNNLNMSQVGSYDVVIQNAFGQETSSTATLKISPVAGWGSKDLGQLNMPDNLTNLVAVAAGGSHNLGLRADGTLVAWGDGTFTQNDLPSGLNQVSAIAAGAAHSLALKLDGTVVSWGYNYAGQTTVPPGLSNVVAVASGAMHSMALKADGTVIAWGDNSKGQTNIPTGLSGVTAIAAGGSQSMALKSDGTVVHWGDDSFDMNNLPQGLSGVVAIAAGSWHCLALKNDGTLSVWGDNRFSQLQIPADLKDVVVVAANDYHSLALKKDGTVVAWGYNDYGQSIVPAGLSHVMSISVGGSHDYMLLGGGAHSLALQSTNSPTLMIQPKNQTTYFGGSLYLNVIAYGQPPIQYQWQVNGKNIDGATNPTFSIAKLALTDAGKYRALISNANGTSHSDEATVEVIGSAPEFTFHPANVATYLGGKVTLKASSKGTMPILYQWRHLGQDIPGATQDTFEFVAFTPQAAGEYDVVASNVLGSTISQKAVLTLQSFLIWGWNQYGQSDIPGNLGEVIAVAGGDSHTIVLKKDGTVASWGNSLYNQTQVPSGLSQVTAIAAGAFHSIALKSDGTMIGWGENSYGQTSIPTAANNPRTFAVGKNHNLVIKMDGMVFVWGDNSYGQLDAPTDIGQVKAIAAGGYHNLVVKLDGTVVAWGYNRYGQLNVPSGLNDVVAVAAGELHSLALKADGTLVGWGYNQDGQNTIPDGLKDVIAIAAGTYHNLALRRDGRLVVWGGNWFKQATPPEGLTNIWAFAGGAGHTLALSSVMKPSFISQPAGLNAKLGEKIRFKAVVKGNLPITYQWQLNGVDISGATSDLLEISNAQPNQSGIYTLVANNAFGATTSSAAAVTVSEKSLATVTWTNPADISYGTALGQSQLNATASVPGDFVYEPPAGSVLNAGLGQVLKTVFNPTDSATYGSVTQTVLINVHKILPVITWNNPADVVYGTALGPVQLNATANAAGTFAYEPASGAVLNAGLSQGLKTVFTPADGNNFLAITQQVQINVLKALPVITWTAPADIMAGIALGNNQLNATANVPGSFVYEPAVGTVLNAGDGQTLKASFTPTDTLNYQVVTQTVALNIKKMMPVITWPKPGNITYGTPLSSDHLNATANIPGSFLYNPPAGVYLQAGDQSLSVQFTPENSGAYQTVSQTVTIAVDKLAPAITWNSPADITFGTALGNAQLNASTFTDGTYVYDPPAGTVLQTGDNQALKVVFTPGDTQNFLTTTLTVTINVKRGSLLVTWPQPSDIIFGTALSSVQLNAGSGVPGKFEYTPTVGTILNAGDKQELQAVFTPEDLVNYQVITQKVILNVLKASPKITWDNPAEITYGAELGNLQLNARADIEGSFSYNPAAKTILNAGDAQILTAVFTPTDIANYQIATQKVTLSVKKATSSVTWANPTDIAYKTALTEVQLNATANVPGQFQYTPSAGTVLDGGQNQKLSVVFTPTDSQNYLSASQTVTINVTAISPVISWDKPQAIGYGTALSDIQLSAKSDVPGSFNYTPLAGTKLNAGDQSLMAVFHPSATQNYLSVTQTVLIQVTKAKPILTWKRPADITKGTSLGASQLNATADVEGRFEYNPPAGAMLDIGNDQTLNAKFIPSNATNYEEVEITTFISVALVQTLAIIEQPLSQTLLVGANLVLSVKADGTAPLSYQWQKDGANLSDQTNNILTINGITKTNAGGYVVMVKDASGQLASQPAVITINEPVRAPFNLSIKRSTNKEIILTLKGDANAAYVIQSSANFKDWSNVQSVTTDSAGTATLTLANPSAIRTFYRGANQQ